MISPYNNHLLKPRRKELRTNQTEAERKLWFYLRNKKLNNLKFFRQYSVGGYILDFYSPKVRLAIELDGEDHKKDESIQYDKTRSGYLKNFDIQVIRFWNKEAEEDIERVIQQIINKITPSIPLT